MSTIDHAGLMNRVYRHQRHFYDATRKFYLLGRDPMLAGLNAPPGGAILELGCGTGRNLVRAAELYPTAEFFGIDISGEMLTTARSAIVNAGMENRTCLAQADATRFRPAKLFGRDSFDRIFISYALSMIPSWQAVLANAVCLLSPGGQLHIVDFGDLRDLPDWTRSALYKWLHWHHVSPRRTLFEACADIARHHGCESSGKRLYRGFAWVAVIQRPN